MLINVTQAHIDAGMRQDCGKCPVALAVKEVMNDSVSVDCGEIRIGLPHCVVYKQPESAKDFIRHFDSGCDVSPFQFTLSDDLKVPVYE